MHDYAGSDTKHRSIQQEAEKYSDGSETEQTGTTKIDDAVDAQSKRPARFPQALVWG